MTEEHSHLPYEQLSLLTPSDEAEGHFLAKPHSRDDDVSSAVRIFLEFLRGYDALQAIDRPVVTIFGSARFDEDRDYYQLARATAKRLAEEGLAVMTGGGPGIMEAANRGAKEGGGLSIGAGINLPFEQGLNPHLDIFVEFGYFFVRKVMLVKCSSAFIVMPGGFGTLDEVFETLTLIQTDKIHNFPVICMGTAYWNHLNDFLHKALLAEGTISRKDLDLITLTDSIDVAVATIKQSLPASVTL